MRIGIDLRLLAAGRRTGVEEYTLGLLEALFEIDRENEYILFFNAWGKSEPKLDWTAKYKNVRLQRFRIPNKLLNFSLWYFSFPKLDELLGGVDAFFMPNLNFAAFSKNVKLIVTAHDLSFEYFPETFSWKQRTWHYLINFRKLLRRADRVIAVSQSTKSDLERLYGIPQKKIMVMYSGVDERFKPLSRNDPALVDIQRKYDLPYRFILFLGTLEPRKNIEGLLAAYETLQESAIGETAKFDLVLAGSPGWKSDPLLEAIKRSPSREKIHLLGFIQEEDKTALYNLASIFVYPSLYEGFGFPSLEAIACGIPTIASHSAALPEVVGDAGILIDPYRPDEILQALRELLRRPELAEMLRKNASERRKLFGWRETAQSFLETLRELGT